MKNILKKIIPPIFFEIYNNFRRDDISFSGDYSEWSVALNNSTSYDSNLILETTKKAVKLVLLGKASYERDSAVFYQNNYNWKLISLLLTSALKGKKLNVVDFGGSLGSSFLQNRKFLEYCSNLKWNVIEQKKYVEVGNALFSSFKTVQFFANIQELDDKNIDVLFMSCVLPYLKSPYDKMDELLKYNPKYIIIDRHPFLLEGVKDVLTIQKIPSNIYKASYPAWFFNKEKFYSYFKQKYHLIDESKGEDNVNYPCEYKTLLFERKKND